jgi:predicted house-cleaning noncanonical NTP pyrophosphatase (MazG superfamily)
MPTYNKLVRDKIPQIIESKGKTFSATVLNDEDYIKYLKEKAYEELEELADLLEVIRALAKHHGSSTEEVEAVRKEKAEKRGGFEEKVFLIGVEDWFVGKK